MQDYCYNLLLPEALEISIDQKLTVQLVFENENELTTWPDDTKLKVTDYPAFVEVTEQVVVGRLSPREKKTVSLEITPFYGSKIGE